MNGLERELSQVLEWREKETHWQAHLPNWMTPRTVRDPVSKRKKRWTVSVERARVVVCLPTRTNLRVHMNTPFHTH